MKTGLEKPKQHRNPKYLAWIREHPCAVCGAPAQSEAHHARKLDPGRPTQNKVSDYNAIPLCTVCHSYEHRGMGLGESELYEIAFTLLREYIEGLDD